MHGYLIPQTLVVVPLLVLAVSLVASWMLCSFGQGGRERRHCQRFSALRWWARRGGSDIVRDCSGGINRVFDNKLDNMTTYGRQKSP